MTPSLTGTTSYYVVVSNACDSVTSRTATVTVRTLHGSVALSWASTLPAGVPAPATGQPIRADYLQWLRSAMNTARGDLGLGAINYTDPVLAGVPIRAAYLTEIFGGAQ